ncbi:unnamed protein product, partial [Mycena citricolor]
FGAHREGSKSPLIQAVAFVLAVLRYKITLDTPLLYLERYLFEAQKRYLSGSGRPWAGRQPGAPQCSGGPQLHFCGRPAGVLGRACGRAHGSWGPCSARSARKISVF